MAQSNYPTWDDESGDKPVNGDLGPDYDREGGVDEGGTTFIPSDELQTVLIRSCLKVLANYNPKLEEILGLCKKMRLRLEPIYSTILTNVSGSKKSEEAECRKRIFEEFCTKLEYVVRVILQKIKKADGGTLLFLTPDKQKREKMRGMAEDYLKAPGIQHSVRHFETLLGDIQNLRSKFRLSLSGDEKEIPQPADSDISMGPAEPGPEVA